MTSTSTLGETKKQMEIDWRECIKDSPKFRSALIDHEKDIESLEAHLEKLVKQCDAIVDAGRNLQIANSSFLSNLQSLMIHFKDDTALLSAIGTFSETLTSWHQNHYSMLEKCNGQFSKSISSFIKSDLKKVKDTKKNFHRMSAEVDNAFGRNAQVSKSRQGECEEAASMLTIARNNFKKSSLDYVYEINIIQLKKKTEILDCLIKYLNGHECFLNETQSNFVTLKPHLSDLTNHLEILQGNTTVYRQNLRKELNVALDCVMNPGLESSISSVISSNSHVGDVEGEDVPMEGYLYKRTSNAFKSWVRRWFIVENNQLLYCSQHRSRDGAVMLERDLRLCNVMPFQDTERRFCFQIVSPVRTHLLQADNEKDCHLWVATIQETARKAYNKMNSPHHSKSISSADLRDQSCSPPRSQSTVSRITPSNTNNTVMKVPRHIKSIFSIEGNDLCCDCNHPDPRWASFNLGITLCIECSGIHRSFGVHKSKVKSVTLDAWDDDQIQVMEQLGNVIVKKIFEADVDESIVERAAPTSNRGVREAWITAKYIRKSFVTSRHRPTAPKPLPRSSSYRKSQVVATENTTTEADRPSEDNEGGDDSVPRNAAVDEGSSNRTVVTSFKNPTTTTTSDIDVIDKDTSYWLGVEADTPASACKLLCRAAAAGSLPGMLRALALGADANYRNEDDEGKTPLIYSLMTSQMAPVEFMLLHGAKVDIADSNLRTPLHHAASLGNTRQIYLLLKRRANHHLKDVNGQDPLSIAVDKADANVVTVLRLALLKEEMKGSDGGFDDPSDDIFENAIKDFTSANNSNNTSTNDDDNDDGGKGTRTTHHSSSAVTLPTYHKD